MAGEIWLELREIHSDEGSLGQGLCGSSDGFPRASSGGIGEEETGVEGVCRERAEKGSSC